MKKTIFALMANLLLAVLLTAVTGLPAWASFTIVSVLGELTGLVKIRMPRQVAFVGLAQEVWIPLVKENFYPSNSFLSAAMDMSSLVDNDKINFAEAGGDPNVLVNNTTYPIPENVAADTPLEIVLDYYDTDSTIVRNAVAVELAYDQRALYARKHQKALQKKVGIDAIYNFAPTQANTGNKNAVVNLGSGDSMIDGIIDLQKHYNDVDDAGTDRVLVLCPAHMAKIAKEDKVLYKAIMAEEGSRFYSFQIYQYSQNPIYVGATGVKAAKGTAFVGGTHKLASIAFLGSEVMKAMGTVKLFSSLNDPRAKGDIFNYQMRFHANTLRGKYMGAVLQ